MQWRKKKKGGGGVMRRLGWSLSWVGTGTCKGRGREIECHMRRRDAASLNKEKLLPSC